MTYLDQLAEQLRQAELNPTPKPVTPAGRIPVGSSDLASYVQQVTNPGTGGVQAMNAKNLGAPTNAMQRAIMAGQVTPDELMPRLRNATPEMGLTRPVSSIGVKPPLALNAGAPPRVAPGGVVPGSGAPIPVPAPLALGPAGSTGQPLASQAAPNTGNTRMPFNPAGTKPPVTEAAKLVEKGLLAKVNGVFPKLGISGVNLSGATLLQGASVAFAGLAASGFVDSMDIGGENSDLDRGLSGGLKGAGLGAGAALALGVASGPVGWAALGGAALFGIGEAFLWGDDESSEDKINNTIDKANETIDSLLSNPEFGIDTETARQVRLQVSATTELFKSQGDKAGLDAYLKGLAATVPTFLMEAQQRNQVAQQRLQMQAAFGPVYARMMDRSSSAATQAFNTQMQAASSVGDAGIRATLQAQAADNLTANQNLLAAYTQQVAGATQQLPPAAQGVVDETQALMQQAMQPVI